MAGAVVENVCIYIYMFMSWINMWVCPLCPFGARCCHTGQRGLLLV